MFLPFDAQDLSASGNHSTTLGCILIGVKRFCDPWLGFNGSKGNAGSTA